MRERSGALRDAGTARRRRRAPLLAGLLFALATQARALPVQGGYTQEQYPELGLAFPRPRDYEEIPLPPDEPYVVLQFGAKQEKARMGSEALDRLLEGVTRLAVVVIEWFPDPEPPPDETSASRGSGKGTEEEEEPELPITTLQRYVDQRLPDWDLGPGSPGAAKKGYESSVHALRTSGGLWTGQAHVFRNDERTIALIGFCAEDQLQKQEKIWRSMASKLEIAEPEQPDLTKLQRLYARSEFRRADYRIGVRSRLVRGWEATDLENYIVVSHTKDEKLLRRILRDLEAIRAQYVRLFPSAAEIDAVSTVRICRDFTEYQRYGGPPGSAGFWNPRTEELVLFDAVVHESGERPDDDDTFIILYHEAFHQYIHYSAGELAPHDWFNEGYGDYFSGAVMKGGKVQRIDPNPWRFLLAKVLCAREELVPWKRFLELDHEQFYEPFTRARNYAQAWSMIYFLEDPKVQKQHPAWAGILPLYFATLKEAWNEELRDLDLQDAEARAAAEARARERALRSAFEGHDLHELQEAWRAFLLAL